MSETAKPPVSCVIQKSSEPVSSNHRCMRGMRLHRTEAKPAIISIAGSVWTSSLPTNSVQAEHINAWANHLVLLNQ